MKKIIKVALFAFLVLIISCLTVFLYIFHLTSKEKLNLTLLNGSNREIILLDDNNVEFSKQSNGKDFVSIKELPNHVKNAFIAVEDKRFYQHKGVDYKGLFRATVKNVSTLSFKEGGSTITQQLIKNTHLNNEKSLKRKFSEIKLALNLEKKLSKAEILQSYLNTIYFGDGCYGIQDASNYYFSKDAKELTVEESAVLAGIINAPSKYSPFKNYELCMKRKKTVLKRMKEEGYITQQIYNDCINSNTEFSKNKARFDYSSLIGKKINEYIENSPYDHKKMVVSTFYNSEIQEKTNDIIESFSGNYEKSIVVMDKYSNIVAYSSTIGDVNRQAGSVIKPILVYSPAIDLGTYDSCSIISDEITTINGYSPKNYGNNYLGKISIKKSLAKSSNVCAVKILDKVGISKATFYVKNMNLGIKDNTNNLSIALGASEDGCKLTNLVASYSVFVNNGRYYAPSCIKNVNKNHRNLINTNVKRFEKVFSEDSAEIVRDMLNYTIIDGTAKGLQNTSIPLCAKTGTVGNINGNTDAYCISFNKEYIVGVWVGNKQDDLLDNRLTGGGLPTRMSSELWQLLYKDKTPPTSFTVEHAEDVLIDKLSYEETGEVLIADSNAPERYVQHEFFTKNRIPKNQSKTFSIPKIQNANISVEYNGINIQLCVIEQFEFVIFRDDGRNKKKIYDSIYSENKKEFLDKRYMPSTLYTYSIIPYYVKNDKVFYGEEFFLDKIKSPTNNVGEDWWNN